MEKDTRYNFFQKLEISVCKFKDYLYFNNQPIKKAFYYLIMLSLLLGVITAIKPAITYYRSISNITNVITTQAPDFTFKNNRLQTATQTPSHITINNLVVVIDTTGKTTTDSLGEHRSFLLITSDKIYKRQGSAYSTINFDDFKQLSELRFSKSDLVQFLPHLKIIAIVILLFAPIKFFLSYLLNVLVLSLIGLIINSSIRSRLRYGNILKLCIYALTLPTLINIILAYLSINLPLILWIIKMTIASIILAISFTEIRDRSNS